MLNSINPHSNELIDSYREHSQHQVETIINSAWNCFNGYRESTFTERSTWLRKSSELLKSRRSELAMLMTLEMGKPIQQSYAEIDKCSWVCEFYAENGPKYLTDEIVQTEATKSYVTFQPLGVILGVMPWNFPFWQVFRFACPTLMAGNTCLLKHSSNVSGCALAIEDIFRLAGFPSHAFTTLLIPGKKVESVIAHKAVKAVSLTGSTATGIAIAGSAARYLKKTVLELGGSDPYIVLDDADIKLAADASVTSRLINSGQSCIAAKRFIVTSSIYRDFCGEFLRVMSSKKMGNPADSANDIGPQARLDLRDELDLQVKKSVQEGAKLLLGGKTPDMPGAYYPPTILSDVKPGMTAFEEELFGPAAAIVKADTEDEAIQFANRSPFGLGAAVFTSDTRKGEVIAKTRLEAGSCFVNSFVKSDPRLPFGGIKQSGYGRELALYGIREFVNIKSVYIR
ncbi:MAG: NAD-dependent succinate-semialdehyde dehydrogenase [Ignavibacteria bacterium]|nr:NAD-dependent succinate-semialdehyde dehydrogenase [Ignavibacteria bacterium]